MTEWVRKAMIGIIAADVVLAFLLSAGLLTVTSYESIPRSEPEFDQSNLEQRQKLATEVLKP